MKLISLLLSIILIILPFQVYALEFPFKLYPGTYENTIEEGDVWTVYNNESHNKLIEKIGMMQLELNYNKEMFEIENKYLINDCNSQLKLKDDVNNIQLVLLKNENELLKYNLKKAKGGSIFGIPTWTISFVIGFIFGAEIVSNIE